MLSPRQIAIAAEYLDGRTQAEIASEQGIDQATVSRDLQHVRKTCERFGRTLPKPQRVHARKEQQLTDGIYHLI